MASSISRVTSRRLATSQWRAVVTRGIRSSAPCSVAQNFPMPALSPTMTEGTISSWKLKEGDSFSAGDVILEIETDKAQMDVEAQEDGILAKITHQAGKEPIQVGKRIAVLAEPGDDLSSLEIPADDSPSTEKAEAKSSAPQEKIKDSGNQPESIKSKEPEDTGRKETAPGTPKMPGVQVVKDDESTKSDRKNPFVPSPALEHLLHLNDLKMADVKGTGPKGRVLKGDVLAHIGKIDKAKPSSLAEHITKLSKLDLSNIKIKKAEPKKAKEEKKELPKNLELQVEISLARALLLTTSSRPITSIINNAVSQANSNLPKSQIPPSVDDLFNEILDLPVTSKPPSYKPLMVPVVMSSIKPPSQSAADVFDFLIGLKPESKKTPPPPQTDVTNVFTITVPRVDEKRGHAFLAKFKDVLEGSPESLL